MRKAPILYFLLSLLLVSGWFLTRKNTAQPAENNRFADKVDQLVYTKHGRCRMDCRQISQNDINDIMRTGEINYAKTDVNDMPCPTYAVQGYSNDGQHLRVIFAQCKTKTKVVTCYDLEKDFECNCPGDENKKTRK